MFAPTRYIAWAQRLFGKVDYDLATSGIPIVHGDDLAPIAEPGARRAGDVACYAELRARMAVYNCVAAAEVVPALGTTQGIFLAYAALLSPGDEILVEHPGYEPLTRIAEGLGVHVRTFARDPAQGYRLDPAAVAAAMTPRTRAIVVTNLQNPTGVRTDDDTIRELARIAEAQAAHVIVDEVYAPFDGLTDDGVFHGSARNLAPNVLAIGSLTKAYGLGNLRVGWLLAPEAVAARALDAIISVAGHLPLVHASFGVAAFDHLPALSARAKALFAGKRAIAEAWAKGLGLGWSAPREGLYGLVTVPGAGDLLAEIEAHAVETGVLVSAGSFFGVPDGFRLSWASCDEARFREGLTRLARLPSISASASRPR